MGTWGNGPFENDMAADLLADFVDAPDAADLLDGLLRRVIEHVGYLEEPDGSGAVAAAATAVALFTEGPEADALADEVSEVYVDAERGPELLALGALAFDRVLGADSELLELWDDLGDDGFGLGCSACALPPRPDRRPRVEMAG